MKLTQEMMTKENSRNLALLFLRLAAGGLLLFHGVAKIQNGISFIEGSLVKWGLPGFLAYGVYVGEVIATTPTYVTSGA